MAQEQKRKRRLSRRQVLPIENSRQAVQDTADRTIIIGVIEFA